MLLFTRFADSVYRVCFLRKSIAYHIIFVFLQYLKLMRCLYVRVFAKMPSRTFLDFSFVFFCVARRILQ